MNIALWIAQIILAGGYGFAGSMKIFKPDSFRTNLQTASWANERSDSNLRSIGIPEVLGALGLILPMITGILPWLTPLAAVGLSVIQLIALFTVHLPKKEPIMPNVILFAMSTFVAIGRWYLFS